MSAFSKSQSPLVQGDQTLADWSVLITSVSTALLLVLLKYLSVQCAIQFPQSTHSTKPSNLTESKDEPGPSELKPEHKNRTF